MFGRYPPIILLFKSTIFLLLETRITSSFSLAIQRVVVGSFTLTSWSHYMLEQLELFLIMLLLRSIDNTFSLQSTLNVLEQLDKVHRVM